MRPSAETRMAANPAIEEAISNALDRQPKHIFYPDYETTEDFSLWLSGYVARIREAHGFKVTEDEKVRAEVVRSISGKLSVGSALDAYNRLDDPDKTDYDRLSAKLTEEFVDPAEKRVFNEDMSYNKRQKGQSLKEFIQEIKKDMNKYSTIPDKVPAAGGGMIDNPEKERQGVRRFRAGIRDKKGKKNKELKKHLLYHLVDESELTWETAITVTTRWESAQWKRSGSSSSSSSSSSSDDKAAVLDDSPNEKDSGNAISALAKQVLKNKNGIEELRVSQDKLIAAFSELKSSFDELNETVQGLSQRYDNQYLHEQQWDSNGNPSGPADQYFVQWSDGY